MSEIGDVNFPRNTRSLQRIKDRLVSQCGCGRIHMSG